jgi:hypothetical protein
VLKFRPPTVSGGTPGRPDVPPVTFCAPETSEIVQIASANVAIAR